eukprot:756528-Hanusia_phi.AAC.3
MKALEPACILLCTFRPSEGKGSGSCWGVSQATTSQAAPARATRSDAMRGCEEDEPLLLPPVDGVFVARLACWERCWGARGRMTRPAPALGSSSSGARWL